jgi:hypothetical protein
MELVMIRLSIYLLTSCRSSGIHTNLKIIRASLIAASIYPTSFRQHSLGRKFSVSFKRAAVSAGFNQGEDFLTMLLLLRHRL